MRAPDGRPARAYLGSLLVAGALAGALLLAGQAMVFGALPSGDAPKASSGPAVRPVSLHAARAEGGALLAIEEVLAVLAAQGAPAGGLRVHLALEGPAGRFEVNASAAEGSLNVTVLRDPDGSAAGEAGLLNAGDLLHLRVQLPAGDPALLAPERVARTLAAPGWADATLVAALPKAGAGPVATTPTLPGF